MNRKRNMVRAGLLLLTLLSLTVKGTSQVITIDSIVVEGLGYCQGKLYEISFDTTRLSRYQPDYSFVWKDEETITWFKKYLSEKKRKVDYRYKDLISKVFVYSSGRKIVLYIDTAFRVFSTHGEKKLPGKNRKQLEYIADRSD